MLTFDPRSGHPFRIAGTRVCAVFGRELKGAPFTDIWAPASRDLVRETLTTVATETVGLVAGATGTNHEGLPLELEFLVLPLAHRGNPSARILGALVPTEVPYWLGTETLNGLTLGMIRYLGPQTDPASLQRSAPVLPPDRRLRHGLVVHDGGRA
jgi:hypothetical protein